jgi:phosphoribosyl 1,2-cyclic phosphodiesterase
MCLSAASLNSGSNGNCYYIESANDAVLIDAGISCKEVEKRMARLGLSPQKIRAVFITHEHSDHIYGLASFLKKFPVPVYVTPNTLKQGIDVPVNLVSSFKPHNAITIGELSIVGFSKLHDAVDPFSFIVTCSNVTVGVFTDIGFACSNVIHYFRQCNAAFLEANYDAGMLVKGRYPAVLKKRISGGKGHLSNAQALELFVAHRPSFMTHLFLSHLSHNNNRPQIVEELFNAHADDVNIIVASRFKETALHTIQAAQEERRVIYYRQTSAEQLSFAFT